MCFAVVNDERVHDEQEFSAMVAEADKSSAGKLVKEVSPKQRVGSGSKGLKTTTVIDGAPYRLIDIKKEQADLNSKKKIVELYLDSVKTANRSKDPTSADILEKVIRLLAEPYSGQPGYRK